MIIWLKQLVCRHKYKYWTKSNNDEWRCRCGYCQKKLLNKEYEEPGYKLTDEEVEAMGLPKDINDLEIIK